MSSAATSHTILSLALFVSTLCNISGVQGNPDEDALFIEIFNTRLYNRLTRPVVNLSQTIHVKLGLVLQKIVQVDESHEVLHANMWNRLKWRDYRLKWNASEFGGVDKIYIPVSKLWIPDITLWNNAQVDKTVIDLDKQFAAVYWHGLVHWWMPIGESVAHCPVDITWFPLDIQNCPLIYESWSMPTAKLTITPLNLDVDLSYYQPSGEWELVGVPVTTSLIDYNCCTTPFSRIVFTIQLRRKSLFYIINLFIPCCLFSVIAVVTFVLPPESGERVGIGIAILLSLSVYQTIVNEKLPSTSDTVPLLGIYFAFVMLISAISVSVTMLVLCIYHKAPSNASTYCMPVPQWVRRHICGHLACFLRVTTVSSCNDATCNDVMFHDGLPVGKHQSHKFHRSDEISNNRKQKVRQEDNLLQVEDSDVGVAECVGQVEANGLRSTLYSIHDLLETSDPAAASATTALVHSISSVERRLTSIYDLLETRLGDDAQLRHQADKNQQMMNEWMIAAAVIDRFCFIVFSLCFVIGTSVLFVIAMFADQK